MRRILTTLALCASCADPPLVRDVDGAFPNHNAPLGRIEGTIVYEGPAPPVDAAGRPIGRVVLLLFQADSPPPPQGFATSARSVATIPASQLFTSITPTGDGRVRASAPFTFPGIDAADTYQLRAFYSARGDEEGFHPLYGVRSQPQRGDVGGGALVDANPGAPVFQRIPVGQPGAGGRLTLPAEGAVTAGVTVLLGSPVTTDRPVFHVSPAGSSLGAAAIEAPPRPGPAFADWAARTGSLAPSSSPDGMSGQATRALVLRSNVATADPAMFLATLPTLAITGGLPPNELAGARRAGVRFANPIPLRVGTPYQPAHPTLVGIGPMGPSRLPWIFPLVMLVRLHDPTPEERAVLSAAERDPLLTSRIVAELSTPASPAVVLFGSVTPEAGLGDFASLVRPPPAPPIEMPTARVVFSPVALEIRGPDPARDWSAIVPRLPAALAEAVAPLLPPGSRCAASGIPSGRYGLFVITERGQSWTLPNELAPRLGDAGFAVSQGVVVRVDASPQVAGTQCPPGIRSSP